MKTDWRGLWGLSLRIKQLLFLSLLLLSVQSADAASPERLVLQPSDDRARGGCLAASCDSPKIDFQLRSELSRLGPNKGIGVIVRFQEQADLEDAQRAEPAQRAGRVVELLQEEASRTESSLSPKLEGLVDRGEVWDVKWLWILNGYAATVTAQGLENICQWPEVTSIVLDAVLHPPEVSVESRIQDGEEADLESWNLARIRAPDLWALGYWGQGVVVASMDTGVDLRHPGLGGQWRGGANSWFDPYGEYLVPSDGHGHGTQTMGAILGLDALGKPIGAAPKAKWIAVRIFNARNEAIYSRVHEGFQWLLDPDGDPATPDAPHVVNNSWASGSPGCNDEFQPDVRALRAAGILPLFAAGNLGPGHGTDTSPANYGESFAVGAIDRYDSLYTYSSQGPSSCDESDTVFPEIVAPGVRIYTTDRYGGYTRISGTSVAVAHAAGVMALLMSAQGHLGPAELSRALTQGAGDLGLRGPDNDFGYGSLDAWAAYRALLQYQDRGKAWALSSRLYVPLLSTRTEGND